MFGFSGAGVGRSNFSFKRGSILGLDSDSVIGDLSGRDDPRVVIGSGYRVNLGRTGGQIVRINISAVSPVLHVSIASHSRCWQLGLYRGLDCSRLVAVNNPIAQLSSEYFLGLGSVSMGNVGLVQPGLIGRSADGVAHTHADWGNSDQVYDRGKL